MQKKRKYKAEQDIIYAWCRSESTKEVKVGKSTIGRIYGRIITAQTDNPYNIRLLGIELLEDDISVNNREKELIDRFGRIRDGGEWVFMSDDLQSWLDDNCLSVDLSEFKIFHRDKTRNMRKDPDFVKREREATRERRAKSKEEGRGRTDTGDAKKAGVKTGVSFFKKKKAQP